MDLTQKTVENVAYMVEEIKQKLRVVSGAAIKGSHFNEDQYDDIKDLYDLVNSKDKFSISEIEAIVAELGKLRKA
ncbi:DUF1128 domain-containing protein [Paenibacillus turpanensis]|uniref:DUF1128 domain-containing protein n=1 Tax=Paenibacillus turpanensis TaxID=2689078 RepID=UPI0014096A44|nr:DUF1128 domain-containing protein [Paenibacillus turpanensis]